jgi:hypothetical protein
MRLEWRFPRHGADCVVGRNAKKPGTGSPDVDSGEAVSRVIQQGWLVVLLTGLWRARLVLWLPALLALLQDNLSGIYR